MVEEKIPETVNVLNFVKDPPKLTEKQENALASGINEMRLILSNLKFYKEETNGYRRFDALEQLAQIKSKCYTLINLCEDYELRIEREKNSSEKHVVENKPLFDVKKNHNE